MAKNRVNRATETQIALAALRVAAGQPEGIASFARLKREIPELIKLSAEDLERSQTRPNEAMWEQQIRNIKSHHQTEGNYICEGYLRHIPKVGYEATEGGRLHLKRKGY